jgi:hypothetical protein
MYIQLDPLDFDVYRTYVLMNRSFIRSLLRGTAEPIEASTSFTSLITYDPPKMVTYTNQAIVQGIYLNDDDTFNYIAKVSYKSIERYICNNQGEIQDAEDVYIDAIEQLIEIVGRGNFVLNTSIEAYLYSIAKNLWSKIFIKKHLRQPYDPDPDDPKEFGGTIKTIKRKISRNPKIIPLDDTDMEKVGIFFDIGMVSDVYPDDYDVIKKYIEFYTGTCRALLIEHYYYKKAWKQVAEELGYANEESARQQCSKCKSNFLKGIRKGKIQIDEKLVNPKYLTKIHARKYLAVSGKTINHLLKSDQIQSVIVNGKKQFTQDDLNLFIKNEIKDFAFCNKNIIKFDLLNQKYYPFLRVTLYPILHQNQKSIYLHLEGWGKVKFSWKEFNIYFSIADEGQKRAFKYNI